MLGPTSEHAEIRRWAESQDAKPAQLNQYVFDSEPAVLHFVFGDAAIDPNSLQLVSWEHFFATFDLLGLALVYDETPWFEFLQVEVKSAYRFEGKPVRSGRPH